MRPSQTIAQLEETIVLLKRERHENQAELSLLRAHEPEYLDMRPDWTEGLSRQQIALVTILRRAYPRGLSRLQLLELVPGRDHAASLDRDDKLINVLVCNVRKRFGPDAIETIRGQGFRLGQALLAVPREPRRSADRSEA